MKAWSVVMCVMLALFSMSGCRRDSLRMRGELANVTDDKVYMSVLDTTLHMTIVDSAGIVDGSFLFDGGLQIPLPECVVLTIGYQNMVLFVGNDDVLVTGNMLMPEGIRVSGSVYNDSLLRFMDNIPDVDKMARLEAEYSSAKEDTVRRETILRDIRSTAEKQLRYIKGQVEAHTGDPLGPYIMLNNRGLFSVEEESRLVGQFERAMPDHKYVLYLRKTLRRE